MLPAGHIDRIAADDGFTLLEVVCVIAIIAALAMIILPAIPRGTSRTQLESYAIALASLLKTDRNAAIRRQSLISTEVDAAARLVRSGATGRMIRVPNDVTFDALLAARCSHGSPGSVISFFPSGISCGAVIALTRLGNRYEVRVNWLTGGVEIVPFQHS